ncbi:MAG: FtsH protease activity modulator HflK [Acidobacteriota bacterium]|nr:FtsH protease activity modulator HflK [Acidobacteriota bacterium]
MDRDVIDISKVQLPNLSPRLILLGIAAIAGILLVWNSFYQVQPEEVGVIRRLGKFVEPPTQPGLRFKLPFIDVVDKVPVQRQLKLEFGFRTQEAGIRTVYSPQAFVGESLMLTGDLNVAVVEWIIQYRVANPELYLFRVRNVTETFRAMTEAVVRAVVGDRTVTEVLTVGRQEIEITVQARLQEMANQYETGIAIDQVVLQDVNPPDPVKPSWDQVNQAQQQRDRLINEARGEYNRVIPRAEGEAQQTVLQAEGYSLDRVNRSQGDASRFKALYEAYRRAPNVTRRRMYLETMAKVLPRMGAKLYLDKDAEGVLPILPLDTLRGLTGDPQNRGGGQ